MQVSVELRPHVGITQTPLGPVEVDHKQFLVMASTQFTENPVCVGYVGTQDGAPFNGLHPFRKLPQDVKDQIIELVTAAKGGTTVKVFEPPPPIIPDEDDE